MKRWLFPLVFLCVLCIGLAGQSAKRLVAYDSATLLGRLGKPFGTIVKVEGRMMCPRKTECNPTTTLMVDAIDGERVQRQLIVFLKSPFPEGTRLTCYGYETGSFTGDPIDIGKYVPQNLPRRKPFGFNTEFVVVKVISEDPIGTSHR